MLFSLTNLLSVVVALLSSISACAQVPRQPGRKLFWSMLTNILMHFFVSKCCALVWRMMLPSFLLVLCPITKMPSERLATFWGCQLTQRIALGQVLPRMPIGQAPISRVYERRADGSTTPLYASTLMASLQVHRRLLRWHEPGWLRRLTLRPIFAKLGHGGLDRP